MDCLFLSVLNETKIVKKEKLIELCYKTTCSIASTAREPVMDCYLAATKKLLSLALAHVEVNTQAPRPPLPWNGVRQATKHGSRCPHMDIFILQMVAGSEDCLYLNVYYTPNLKPTSPLAVMVFIHGGGYKSDCGDVDHYGPKFLVSHRVVLVTINSRLEALGFLCLNTREVPGNAGMKDQVAALRWVKSNMVNFGDDPENITVFGQSAGGASAALHILSPMSKGLFKRAIPMNGVPFCDWSIPFVPQKRPNILGKLLGLETNYPNKLLEFLERVADETLIDTNPTVMSFDDRNNNVLDP